MSSEDWRRPERDWRRESRLDEQRGEYADDRAYGADERRPRRPTYDFSRHDLRPFGTTGPSAYGEVRTFSRPDHPSDLERDYDPYGRRREPYDSNQGRGFNFGRNANYDQDRATPRYAAHPSEGRGHDVRTWFDRTADEVAAFFGSEDARRRRESDEKRAVHRGRGPRDYRRSDERIREDVNDALTENAYLDASDIVVSVVDGDVTLTGLVATRQDKRAAEDCAEGIPGVRDIQNNLRIRRAEAAEKAGEGPAGA